jgi:hypothetical protein
LGRAETSDQAGVYLDAWSVWLICLRTL